MDRCGIADAGHRGGDVLTLACFAQQLTGTLSGTVYDQSGAVVPDAQILLKNQLSGDTRTAVSGNDGHFVITAVQPASYSITVSANRFLKLGRKMTSS